MSNRVMMVGTTILLAACTTDGIPDFGCPDTVTSCRVVQSAFYGYERACTTTCTRLGNTARDDESDDDAEARPEGATVATTQQGSATPAPGRNVGAAPAPDMTRYSAFEGACERDSQCGPGKCLSGSCYYGCQSDAQCGSGDRCSVETGVRVCMPDPNPAVECTRSAQCDEGSACLNGGCRQTCTSTEECTNLLDRCANGFCTPDRRPLGECVVNSECDEGLVCLDGSCVAACPAEQQDGGVCLAEPSHQPPQPLPESQSPSELPTPVAAESPAEPGSEAAPSDNVPSAVDEAASASGDAPAAPDNAPAANDSAPASADVAATPASDGASERAADDEASDGSGAADSEQQESEEPAETGDPAAAAPVPLAG